MLQKNNEQIFQEIKDLEEHRFKEELDLLVKKHRLERLQKEREHAKVTEGKEKLVVKGSVTTRRSLYPSL